MFNRRFASSAVQEVRPAGDLKVTVRATPKKTGHRRYQTSPPVLTPSGSLKAYALHPFHVAWRLCTNTKVHNVSQRHQRATANDNMRRTFGERWTYGLRCAPSSGWLGSRVVSVLDSGAEGPGLTSQPQRCRVTVFGKLFTPIVPLFSKQRN